MAYYEIIVTNGSVTGTVYPDSGWSYTDKLNDINEGVLKFSSTGQVRRGLLVNGATVEIKKNGVRDFYGFIQTTDNLSAGTVVANLMGQEIKLAREKGDYTNSPYINTASATIANDIITENSVFTAGTINTGFNIDFRISTSQSQWNALSNLAKKTQQDIGIDYVNTQIDVLDHKGSITPVATLNAGLQINNIRLTQGTPKGNYIKVWGKGEGDQQITATDSDATSIGIYGTIRRDVVDRSVMSDSEASRLAAAELSLTKEPTKIYDFDMVNPYQDFSAGDHLYLNATDIDLNNEEVRIVGIERGEKNGSEYMTLQVCNPEFKSLVLTRNKILAQIKKQHTDAESYMQGSGNTLTWGTGINAKVGAPLKLGFYVPASFVTDEAGNIRIQSMTLDYDVDAYNQQFGTASFTGTNPQVQNTSGDKDANVSGTSDSTQPSVSGNSGEGGTTDQVQDSSDTDSSVTLSTSNTKVLDINPFTSDTGGMFIWLALGRGLSSEIIRLEIEIDSSSGRTFYNNSYSYVATDDIADASQAYWAGFIPENTSLYTYDVYVQIVSGAATSESNWQIKANFVTLNRHEHSDGSYNAANHGHNDGTFFAINHGHPDGSYDINSADLNYISITDDVTEAGSVNATGVDIYLDYYNTGTSSWVNKHSILSTAKTIDTEVDITNGGVYPDAVGYWRVRIEPNNATPDFVQGIVNIKHNLDN